MKITGTIADFKQYADGYWRLTIRGDREEFIDVTQTDDESWLVPPTTLSGISLSGDAPEVGVVFDMEYNDKTITLMRRGKAIPSR